MTVCSGAATAPECDPCGVGSNVSGNSPELLLALAAAAICLFFRRCVRPLPMSDRQTVGLRNDVLDTSRSSPMARSKRALATSTASARHCAGLVRRHGASVNLLQREELQISVNDSSTERASIDSTDLGADGVRCSHHCPIEDTAASARSALLQGFFLKNSRTIAAASHCRQDN